MNTVTTMDELLATYPDYLEMTPECVAAKLQAEMEDVVVKPAKKAGRRRTALESDKRAYHIGEKRKEIASVYLKPTFMDTVHSGEWRNGSVSLKNYRPERHGGRNKRYDANVAAEMREAKFIELETA